jgi:hypothetical protein
MKYLSMLLAVSIIAVATACGGGGTSSQTSTSANPATGAWSETLASPAGQQLGSFTFNMAQNSTALSGSNMNFSNMGNLAQCFGSGTVMNGQMGPGMMNGGSMNMTMSWTPQGSSSTNTMTMQGNMAMGMGSGSGTFAMVGQTSGCSSQSGTFSMTHTSSMM